MRFFLFLLTLMLINLPALHKAQADSEGTRINMGQLQESIKQHEEKIAESDEEDDGSGVRLYHAVYETALREKYRLFSYGDCMLSLRS